MNTFPQTHNSLFHRLDAVIFAVFFLSLPLLYYEQSIAPASLPRYSWIAVTAIILLFSLFIQSIFYKWKKQEKASSSLITLTLWHRLFLGFFAWALLSLLWSVDPGNSQLELLQLGNYLVIAFFASQLKDSSLKIIFIALFIGASIAALLGLLQAFALNPFHLSESIPMASTFGNKNHVANYFDLVIPLALIRMLSTKGLEKATASIAFTLLVSFILISKTKGALLAYLVMTIIFLVLIYKNSAIKNRLFKRETIIHYLLLSLLVPLSLYLLVINFAPPQKLTIPQSWNAGLEKSSLQIRLSWYKNALQLLEERALTGTGYGGFRQGFAPYVASPNIVTSVKEDFYVNSLHNDPYQLLLELGIPGALFIFGVFIYLLITATKKLLTTNNATDSILLTAATLALLASLTHSFVDFPLHLPSSAVLFWFITGVLIGRVPSDPQIKKIQLTSSLKLTTISAILLGILVYFNLDTYSRYVRASSLTHKTITAIIKEKDCKTALKNINPAMELFAEDAFIRQRFAMVYAFCPLPGKLKLAASNRVLSYDTANSRAYLTRAGVYLQQGLLAEAEQDYQRVTRLLPHRPAAYNGLGDIATLKKDFAKARKFYEKALKLQPGNQKARMMLQQFSNKGL